MPPPLPPLPPPPHRPPTTPSSSATAPTHRHSPPINFLRAPSDIHPAPPPPFAPCRLQPAPGTTVYRTYVGACALQTVALMPGHCCCHCCYLCCFLVPSQISPLLLLLLLRLILHLLDSRYCSLAPLSPACALPFLYRGCWIVSSSHGFTFPFLRKGLSYTFISLFQFSSFPKFTFHIYIYIGSFFSSSNLAFVPCHVCAFLFSSTRLMVLLFIGSFRFSYLISFLFRYFFSLLFLYSIVFLLVDFSSFFYRYLSLFVILSHFLSTYFHLYYSNISLLFLIILSLFFHRFLSSSLRYLSLFSTIVRVFSPCRFFLASSYFFLYFSLSLIRFCFSFSHIWFLVSSSSKREVRLEVCFVSRTRASLEFLSLRSRRSRSTDSPHPSFLPAPPDDSGIRYNEFRSSYFQGNVIGDV